MSKPLLYFIVGCRDLKIDPHVARLAGFTHACIVLSNNKNFDGGNLYEYDRDGWHKREGVGLTDEFDWEELGCRLKGQTYTTEAYFYNKLKNDPDWKGSEYDIEEHNCHDFVQYVMISLGVTGGMVKKTGMCFVGPKRQKLRAAIRESAEKETAYKEMRIRQLMQ